jgi:hypothetical protein
LRIKSVLSLFAASLIALAPAHALAQTGEQTREEPVSVRERSHPEYRPLGMQLGAFNLNASLDFGIASTDNLFANESGSELDDMIYTVSPTARLASNWNRHALAVEAGAAFESHEDFSNEDADTRYLRATGRLDIGASSSLSASARVAHDVDPRTDPDSPLVGGPVEYDRSNLSVTAAHAFNRLRVSLGVGRNTYDYDGTQSFRDNEETSVRGRVEVDVAPRIGVLLQASADERDYDNSPGLDSDGRSIMAGAILNTDLMRGEVSVGQFERDYSAPALGSFDGVAAAGQLEWFVTRLTTVTLNVQRNADDNVSATVGLPYIRTEFGGRIDHELMPNVILMAGAQAGEREYDTIDRNDEFRYVEVGADYVINRRVALRARYDYDEVDSSGAAANRDYIVNTLTFGVSLRL